MAVQRAVVGPDHRGRRVGRVVGLVLVGHSASLVEGLAAMVRQAAPGVPVETAGGLSGGRLGTSGPAVAGALRRALAAAGEAGVVVLLDLGSAALALDIALGELGDEARSRVRVTEAPFVEGAVIAGVASAGGGDAGVVVAAAEGAMRMPKLPRGWPRRRRSRARGRMVRARIGGWATAVAERRTWLTDLDAAIGDGDHGINLDRGLAAVAAASSAPTRPTRPGRSSRPPGGG